MIHRAVLGSFERFIGVLIENYSGKFYGLTTLREALVQSINIVSIKLLREIGIKKSSETVDNFGFWS